MMQRTQIREFCNRRETQTEPNRWSMKETGKDKNYLKKNDLEDSEQKKVALPGNRKETQTEAWE